MAYMLLIMEPLNQRQGRPRAEGEALYARMLEFAAGLKSRGVLSSGQALKSEGEGVRVASRAGRLTIVDGPFAEAKEMVGGYFLLTCETRADAVAIARTCPAAEWATVEVRELGPCFD